MLILCSQQLVKSLTQSSNILVRVDSITFSYSGFHVENLHFHQIQVIWWLWGPIEHNESMVLFKKPV